MVIVRSMPLRKADGPLTVQLPSPAQDRPSWLGRRCHRGGRLRRRCGVAPSGGREAGSERARIAGRLRERKRASRGGRRVPASVAPAVPVALPSPVAPSSLASSSLPSSTSPSASAGGVRVSVAHGAIFSCKTAGGESLKGTECGVVAGLDGARLAATSQARRLSRGGRQQAGRFASSSGPTSRAMPSRWSSVTTTASSSGPLLACAKSALASATLDGIAHDNPRYSVAYAVTFGAACRSRKQGPRPLAGPAISDATAQVEWDVAIVRDAPKTGKVARAPPARHAASRRRRERRLVPRQVRRRIRQRRLGLSRRDRPLNDRARSSSITQEIGEDREGRRRGEIP